jgi:RimJ/RimL family protein N-acetyltransferase
VRIRAISEDDARRFLDLCTALDDESTLMMYERGERPTEIYAQRDAIRAVLASENSTIIVADADGVLAGYVGAVGGEFNRTRHSAYVVAGVRAAYGGQGIGTALFVALDAWARQHDILRLELTVQSRNAAAIGLYRKMGYEIEGTKRRSLVIDGVCVDELYMAKLLDAPPHTC